MSHFAVLVIGENIEAQLAPYHEFECTGTDDQYIQNMDVTEELRAEFRADTRSMIKLADGSLVGRYDDQFYREPTEEQSKKIGILAGTGCAHGLSWASKDWGDGKGYRTKVHIIPEGAEQVEVPFESFTAWVGPDWHGTALVPHGEQPDLTGEHKYGYALLDEAGEVVRVIRRTNPNSKWDWYEIGGRWSGFLKLKDGAAGALGRKGVMGSCANDGPGRADQALKGAIDFEGMRNEAAIEAAANWDKVAEATGGLLWTSWDQVRAVHKDNIDAARDAYHAQATKKRAVKALGDGFFVDVDQYLTPRDQFIQQARDRATVLYAVVKDGQWIAKGEMGWFGMSSGDEDQDAWNRKVNELLDSLPDDTPITVVDCHI